MLKRTGPRHEVKPVTSKAADRETTPSRFIAVVRNSYTYKELSAMLIPLRYLHGPAVEWPSISLKVCSALLFCFLAFSPAYSLDNQAKAEETGNAAPDNTPLLSTDVSEHGVVTIQLDFIPDESMSGALQDVLPQADWLVSALNKAYAEKSIQFTYVVNGPRQETTAPDAAASVSFPILLSKEGSGLDADSALEALQHSIATAVYGSKNDLVQSSAGQAAEFVGVWLIGETLPQAVSCKSDDCDFTDSSCNYSGYVCSETRPMISSRHRYDYLSGTGAEEYGGFGSSVPSLPPDGISGNFSFHIESIDGEGAVHLATLFIYGSSLYVRDTESGYVQLKSAATSIALGDINGDGQGPNVADIVDLNAYLLKDGIPAPAGLTDVNGEPGVDLSDLQYLINYLLRGGPAPGTPVATDQ
jgi:hypothetical protein